MKTPNPVFIVYLECGFTAGFDKKRFFKSEKGRWVMFRKKLALMAIVCAFWAYNLQADTFVSGFITTDTIWRLANSPYIVTGNVLVMGGVTLTVEQGIVVKFEDKKALQISGKLVARGTDANMITFTSRKSVPAPGDWAYIFFSDSSEDAAFDIDGNYIDGSILEHCIVEYAGGETIDYNGAVRMDNAHPFINHCIVRNNSASGIIAYNLTGLIKITNNAITDNADSGIGICGGTAIISDNRIQNNHAEVGGSYGGGGIFTYSNTSIIFNNIISGNRALGYAAGGGGGGIHIVDGDATITNNIIKDNTLTNTTEGEGGGIMLNYSSTATISNNIIIYNTAGSGGGIHDGGIYGGTLISNNIISDNTASTGGGIYGAAAISLNSILDNSAQIASAVFGCSDEFKYNTLTGNVATDTFAPCTIYLNSYPAFNYNNIFANAAVYELWNNNPAGSIFLNAGNNWWGTDIESEIQDKIYDWFDDATKGVVNYFPFETSIRTDAPVSPPTGLTISKTATDIMVNWDSNPEGDVRGYKVYWGTQKGPFFENVVDVGDSLAYTITELEAAGTYYVAVTAYDADYQANNDDPATIVNENQTNGNESWYAGGDSAIGMGRCTVSGKVTDKATGLPLPNIHVTYWNNDFEVWMDDYTDANGMYNFTNLPKGWVKIRAEPESYYAWIGTEFELTGDINNLDFALPVGASLSGKVIDADTAQPLAGIEVTYWSERYAVWQNDFSDVDGTFTITNLQPGVAEIKAKPNVDTGYAWSLPWPADMIYLNEGEERSNRIVALHKGALVSGYIKDPNGNPLSNFEYDFEGRLCDGWSETDINGQYRIRLPKGTYAINIDEDDFGALPQEVTITDVNQPVNVPDITAYSVQTGGQISGSVNNPGGYPKTGNFIISVFETGTVIDPDTWYTIQSVSETDLQQAGPFAITSLPPGVNCDVHLLVASNTADEIQSFALRDSVFNVPVGTTGVNLYYNSQGSTVTGKVLDTTSQPVLGATVLLTDSTTANFAGFADVDPNGDYIIYNVPAGTYTATAVHSKYLNTSTTTVQIVDGVPANVSTIVMPFAGEKDGADLNGDGLVNMFDFAELANQWLRSGSLEADFTKDNLVDFADLTRIAENWLWQAIWR